MITGKPKITKELLERYVMGECTEDEEKAVEEWTKLSSNSPTDMPREHIDSKKIWNTLFKAAPRLEDQPQVRKSKTISIPRRIARYAESVPILFSVGFSAYYLAY
ncbi:MAG: hypothetical protein AAF551_10965 [Bacteroidota bacterium]